MTMSDVAGCSTQYAPNSSSSPSLRGLHFVAKSKDPGASRPARSRSRRDLRRCFELAEHFDVTTDYLLGLTTVRKQTPTLRSVEEYTGLSEAAIMTIANATGSYAKCWDTINSMDLDRYSDSDVNPFLDEKAMEALDDLLKDGDGRFLAALAEIKRLTGEINDVWEDWKTSGTDEPPLSLQEAIQLHRDLRYALFDLSEEAKASVDDYTRMTNP